MVFAYIDPAVGSMILQGMAAVVLAAMVVGRRLVTAPLEWLRQKTSAPQTDSDIADLSSEK